MSAHFKNLRFDDLGRPVRTAETRSNRSQNQMNVQIFPSKAVPIIFLPGIMGSPLRADGTNGDVIRRGNRWAWFPDEPAGWVAGVPGSGYTWEGFRNTTGAERRMLLNPDATWALTPDDDDITEDVISSIKKSLVLDSKWFSADVKAMSEWEALRRGWATVYWGGYGSILAYLEKYLRHITYSADPYSSEVMALGNRVEVYESIQNAFKTLIKDEDKRFHSVLQKDFPAVDPAKASSYKSYIEELRPILKTGRKYHYPVFAVGYNWTRCNADSAEYAYKRITEQIIPHVKNTLGYSCGDGVILLTHSMGGLVGRSLVKQFPDLKVQAVIHGVQPCNGAATLYARMWAGWEGGKHWYSAQANIAGRSLGRTRTELLPILSNSPGAMELAPNQNYAKGWLRIYEHSTNQLLKSLPKQDPYSEIYLQTNNWLRLGSFEQMNPGQTRSEDTGGTKEEYVEVIKKVKFFHQQIDNFFHDNTYLIYGQFTDYSTWGAVNLKVEGLTLKHQVVYRDDTLGSYNIDSMIGFTVADSNDPMNIKKARYRIEYIERIANREPISLEVVNNAVFRRENDVPQRESGKVDIAHDEKIYQVHMDGGQEPGDGTVPYNSGNPWKAMKDPWEKDQWNSHYRGSQTPDSIKYIFECTEDAYEHSDSYKAETSQNITFYSIMSVIKNKLEVA